MAIVLIKVFFQVVVDWAYLLLVILDLVADVVFFLMVIAIDLHLFDLELLELLLLLLDWLEHRLDLNCRWVIRGLLALAIRIAGRCLLAQMRPIGSCPRVACILSVSLARRCLDFLDAALLVDLP